MLLRRIACLAIALLSVGWLVPLWLAIDHYLYFWEQPGVDLLSRGKTSFQGMGGGPAVLLMFTRHYFTIAIVWFSLVAAFWSYLAASAFLGRSGPKSAKSPPSTAAA